MLARDVRLGGSFRRGTSSLDVVALGEAHGLRVSPFDIWWHGRGSRLAAGAQGLAGWGKRSEFCALGAEVGGPSVAALRLGEAGSQRLLLMLHAWLRCSQRVGGSGRLSQLLRPSSNPLFFGFLLNAPGFSLPKAQPVGPGDKVPSPISERRDQRVYGVSAFTEPGQTRQALWLPRPPSPDQFASLAIPFPNSMVGTF